MQSVLSEPSKSYFRKKKIITFVIKVSIYANRNKYCGGIAFLKEGIEFKQENSFDKEGDLNAKTKSLGCLKENENGLILEKIINRLNLSITNDNTPTYNRNKTSSSQHNSYTENIDKPNEHISKKIIHAAQKSIPLHCQKFLKI
ncbi:hypothetical protein BpHYR1_037470 [Brachionus plicatilis]|uniref:Uncharacterized protein n=1 Tax=Brachionus plicatilis TaxID=10195 RepID=A0A3M7RDC1_BRAPC|nr:hypothetical protein BpHYR1_037470 [Brachionus plicatilis]